jgi:hypothetical protein
VTLQHCLLSTWCSWAKLEFQVQQWHCLPKQSNSCLSSSLAWFFHVPWRLSHENINIPWFILFHFEVFKTEGQISYFKWQTLRLTSTSIWKGHSWISRKIENQRSQDQCSKNEEFHSCITAAKLLDVPVIAK